MTPATDTTVGDYCLNVATSPVVTPLCVFASGRRKFQVIVRGQDWLHGEHGARLHARYSIFSALPLEKHGWSRETAKLSLVRRISGDEAVWNLSRCDT